MSSVILPQVKWAQRKDAIYLTVEVSSAKNVVVDLKEDGNLSFSATDEKSQKYEFSFKLLKEINKEVSKNQFNSLGK